MATIPTSAPIPLAPAGAPAGGSYWFTTGDPGPARPPARGHGAADVAIVGAGFTGLWAAIRLLDTDPSLRVIVLEADRVGAGASGRNGGFCAASLTHGLGNGLLHFPHEIDVLEAEGRRNLAELVAFVRDEGIDCDLEPTGVLDVATEPWQVEELAGVGRARGAARHRARVPRPRRRPGRGPLAALPGRRPGGRRQHRDGQPGQARLGARRRGGAAWRDDRRGERGHGAAAPGGRRRGSRPTAARRSTRTTCSSRPPPTAPGCGRLDARCSCRSTTTSS